MNVSASEVVIATARPVLDSFYLAVTDCGRQPPFRPELEAASVPGATRYDHSRRAVILVPYELLDPARRAAMERFAAIGTLGLNGREQYIEVFNNLLVAHELGHWIQEVSRRPLTRWQVEFEANRMMVAFWREYPTSGKETELRLANFVARSPNIASPVPETYHGTLEDYFTTNIARIEIDPPAYAWFQKQMVREAMTEAPAPTFCQTIHAAWPLEGMD